MKYTLLKKIILPDIRTLSLLIGLLLFTTMWSAKCDADWQWIYSDASCSVYADLSGMKIWQKPEGECVDIRLKTRLTEKGAQEIITGREINSLPSGGVWTNLGYIYSRQLFLTGAPQVQMMSVQYFTRNMDIIETNDYNYAPDRWRAIQKTERSQKVYEAVLNIAGK